LRRADEKNRELQVKVQETVRTNEALTGDIQMLKNVVDTRDKEITRLSSL
jgi:hypothetical protein